MSNYTMKQCFPTLLFKPIDYQEHNLAEKHVYHDKTGTFWNKTYWNNILSLPQC